MKRYVVLGATAVTSYSLLIEYQRQSWKSSVKANIHRSSDVFLNPNSTEAIISDNLNTGDLVLFRRFWHKYHMPTALSICYKQNILKTEFDHVGVVIVDRKGEPFVLESESSCFGTVTYKLYKFSDRMCYSKAKLISVKPLYPRLETSSVSKIVNATSQSLIEGQTPTIISTLITKHSTSNFHAPALCWHLLGLLPHSTSIDKNIPSFIDMKSILSDDFYFSMKDDTTVHFECPVKNSTHGNVRFDDYLVIRTS